ncbi:30S ribosomal protein S21 [Aureisphaera galaxeae]|uniref:30S ribosomal protein S21 n=1 Tax=Aureisphaera galaxeae TaxID=1538023 RepID=UPI002350EC8A|nr:30S ribosomal protein S21 [Aureisphaera galaxeae]MDC8004544.1 30S ribosomal protein S21 [Aureisphaera galaxeae]
MLKIILREGESIDRALKRYKRKHRNVKQMEQIRERKEYKKKSVRLREEKKKAIYRNRYLEENTKD